MPSQLPVEQRRVPRERGSPLIAGGWSATGGGIVTAWLSAATAPTATSQRRAWPKSAKTVVYEAAVAPAIAMPSRSHRYVYA